MKEVPLSKGLVALVSNEDYERVMQFKWTASLGKHAKIYALRRIPGPNGKRISIYMHRFIMGLPTRSDDARVVDHVRGLCVAGHEHDGSGLDNRRCGLEIVSHDENMRRCPGWRRPAEEPCL